jgi:Protein of unknown function (DUF3631)
LDDGNPIAGFDRFAFVERAMWFYPDSDVWLKEREDLRRAVFAYGMMCEAEGAKVSNRLFASCPDGSKCGMDDFLAGPPGQGVDDLLKLSSIPLKHKVFDQARTWWKGWTERGNTSGHTGLPVDELIRQMKRERLLRPAQDYADGILYVGVPVKDKLFLVTSERKAISPQDLPAGLKLDNRGFERCDFSQQGIQSYLAGALDVTTPAILQSLHAYFTRFAIYPKPDVPLLLAIWTLGTYLYRLFEYYAYLVLRSPQKRCGKSRVEDLIALVAFNASSRETNPTEASLFRGPAKNGGVLILDEVEMLGAKDQDAYRGVLSVLNSGFQRGGEVTRMEKRGDTFLEVKYPTYAPRVLAGIKKLAETLEDRAIGLMMQRKRKDEKTERFSPRRLKADTQAMKDRCYVWALTHAADVSDVYEAGEFPELSGSDDRARDLWEPLMTVAYLADEEAREAGERAEYAQRLKALAEDLCQVRNEGDHTTPRLIKVLLRMIQTKRPPAETSLKMAPTALLRVLKGQDPLSVSESGEPTKVKGFEWVKSTKALASLMQPLGLISNYKKVEGRVVNVYDLSEEAMIDLQERYGTTNEGDDWDEGDEDKEAAND